jgi:thioredoxin 1
MAENHPNLFPVSDQDLEQRMLYSALPVIVEFTAERRPPCLVLAPIYARLSSTYQGKLSFAKMDTEENVLVPAHLGIQGIPTFVLFSGGRPMGRVVGPLPSCLQQSIEGLLKEMSAEV